MFTMVDIRNIAIQIEENGEAAYRRAAFRSTDPERARLFTWMADEERSHCVQFAALTLDGPLTPEQAELSVKVWRETYQKAVDFWYDIDRAARKCIRNAMITSATTMLSSMSVFFRVATERSIKAVRS